MIYLIGGAPRCGKTVLARKLSQMTGVSRVSTDDLRAMVLALTPKSQRPKKFPYEGFGSDNMTAHETVSCEKAESKTMWPGLMAMMKNMDENGVDCILEGVHLRPELVARMRRTKLWGKVKVIYLVKSDLDSIASGFLESRFDDEWVSKKPRDGDLRMYVAGMVLAKSHDIANSAKKHRLKLVDTSADFDKAIRRCLEYLTS